MLKLFNSENSAINAENNTKDSSNILNNTAEELYSSTNANSSVILVQHRLSQYSNEYTKLEDEYNKLQSELLTNRKRLSQVLSTNNNSNLNDSIVTPELQEL